MSVLRLFAAALLLAASPVLAAGPDDQLEQAALEGINAERTARGLKPLRPTPELQEIARAHSRDMFQSGELSHRGPTLQGPTDRARAAGIRWRRLGENVAMNDNAESPAQAAVRGWMHSPGHRSNILTPEFTQTGVGVWGQDGKYYFTQVFLTPPASR